MLSSWVLSKSLIVCLFLLFAAAADPSGCSKFYIVLKAILIVKIDKYNHLI